MPISETPTHGEIQSVRFKMEKLEKIFSAISIAEKTKGFEWQDHESGYKYITVPFAQERIRPDEAEDDVELFKRRMACYFLDWGWDVVLDDLDLDITNMDSVSLIKSYFVESLSVPEESLLFFPQVNEVLYAPEQTDIDIRGHGYLFLITQDFLNKK
jgi:hypothetical protein